MQIIFLIRSETSHALCSFVDSDKVPSQSKRFAKWYDCFASLRSFLCKDSKNNVLICYVIDELWSVCLARHVSAIK